MVVRIRTILRIFRKVSGRTSFRLVITDREVRLDSSSDGRTGIREVGLSFDAAEVLCRLPGGRFTAEHDLPNGNDHAGRPEREYVRIDDNSVDHSCPGRKVLAIETQTSVEGHPDSDNSENRNSDYHRRVAGDAMHDVGDNLSDCHKGKRRPRKLNKEREYVEALDD